jgi:hypothetical protein
MLPGASLCYHSVLAHSKSQQPLTESIIDLVGAGMSQVLPLEQDLCSAELL